MVEFRIGENLAKTSYAFKSMIHQKILVAIGTDCPVESLAPFPNLYCALTRQDLNQQPVHGWNHEER